MTVTTSPKLSPVLYLPHGGGPLPILGDPGHQHMVSFLEAIVSRLGSPSAIVVISAHWEASQASLTSGAEPEIIYDYSGFPEAAYHIQYPAAGQPALANEAARLLQKSGIDARLDEQRGFDHGLFVPLKLMYPKADIPCVQLSLLTSLDARQHIALGEAISSLREQNVLIVGSGMSFHNLPALFRSSADALNQAQAFDHWLVETCCSKTMSDQQRRERLINWQHAPAARFCHPREEHLLPLQVCYGAAHAETPIAELAFNDEIMGIKSSGFLWH